MNILDSVLYEEITKLSAKITTMEEDIQNLPKGSIYIRKEKNEMYAYRKWREDEHVLSEYLGKLSSSKTLSKIEKVNEYKLMYEQIKKEKQKLKELKKAYKLILFKTKLN